MESIDIKNLSNENILELFQILTSLNPDQQKISLAQNVLKKFIEIPQSLDIFLHILSTNSSPEIRQASAIMLYKSIDNNWEDIPEEKQEEIKKKNIRIIFQRKCL
jgi:hypothetical protein